LELHGLQNCEGYVNGKSQYNRTYFKITSIDKKFLPPASDIRLFAIKYVFCLKILYEIISNSIKIQNILN